MTAPNLANRPRPMDPSTEAAQAFIERWRPSGGSEQSNYQLFLTELCDLLGVDHPDPASEDNRLNDYVFERAITFDNHDGTSTTKFADLYKRGCFVCETKQGVKQPDDAALLSNSHKKAAKKRRTGHGQRGTKAYDDTMQRAVGQAEQYARNLAPEQGRPPLLMVVDVGHTIELYSEFSQTGGAYVPFPDPRSHRIKLAELADPAIRERLHLAWTDSLALDPSRRSAKVTREIAAQLAELAKSLEAADHAAEDVAHFLMRCLFTMFAEDVELLGNGIGADEAKEKPFTKLLKSIDDPAHFPPVIESLWRKMDTGGFSTELRKDLLQFNGGLFASQSALPLTRDQLDLLIESAEADWQDVEPAIFGTLLERALDPVERHKLGAHYTPRAYVDRLVMPTVVEPLREEWDAARTAALTLVREGDAVAAVAELEAFHDRLCEVKVLDPACGSGNFLYVVLEHLKRIEGEVFDAYEQIAERQMLLDSGHTVDPHQLLGIEINPRAAAIAELVLWIGYLQWHFRTRGKVEPPQPVIKNFKNIECRDAVLAYDSREEVVGDDGQPVTIWDGRTTKLHPVTGREVPDETACVPMYRYLNPRKAEWPAADFVVGNPPFVGNKRMRSALGDGYVDALRKAFLNVPKTVDYVMYWWDRAAEHLRLQALKRFGLVSTNSISQSFNRAVIAAHRKAKEPISIVFAIPNHPWVNSADGADVRIAMTVAEQSSKAGLLANVLEETGSADGYGIVQLKNSWGLIDESLRVGTDVTDVLPLEANRDISFQGVISLGMGFRMKSDEAIDFLTRAPHSKPIVKRFFIGKDISKNDRREFVIDTFGYDADELQAKHPEAFQHLVDHVKPERDQNRRKIRREKWWLFGENAPKMRTALRGLGRYIATIETSKFKPFVFCSADVLPDHKLYAVATDDAFILGILSSRFHEAWAFAAGGALGVGDDPTWTNTTVFQPFSFPVATDPQEQRIRDLGEQLDAHRKRRQAEHPKLTMTGMYNVLEKLRGIEKGSGEELTDKEKTIHEQGLVSVLKQIHDDLDAAVADAYGWPVDLADEEILERLVALNHERAEEEKRGLIRWLRPEFQNPDGATQQTALPDDDEKKPKKAAKEKVKKQPWPKILSEQAAAVQTALSAIAAPADEADVAKRFTRANKDRIAELLETLESLGRARQLDDGRYVAV